ncbi:MAG: DUF1549 and DUF1553 domain-containing protein, partial [Chloroflexi bacterium]|nr:DUF1549 and DUF1553 domain-containing protein [Chloroflexota bacterium]
MKSPIDAFVESRLEHRGLAPAPAADRRTLIRRATYDLIGLPPTQDEINDYLVDRSPDAFAHVVDRLLASPHFGERWARYWLDIARYADTKGYVFVEDRSYPFAYTFRDWVIRSLNEDMPYDQFLVDQLAADQVTPLNKKNLAALGFLTVGRRFLNNPPDIIDDRIDVVCRGMMGLTVSCARCHDHKFDPIPTKDYYSLYGVFQSTDEPKDLPVIDTRARQEAFDLYTRELKSRQDALAAYKAAHKVSLAAMKDGMDPQAAALQQRIDSWSATPPPAPERAMVVEDLPTPVTPHVFLRGNPNNQGDPVPRHFLTLLSGGHPTPFQHGSGRLELARDIASKDNPLTARVIVNRIWMHQFGEGLVRTPSDFGMRADPPTYPDLLDYLASRFVEDGWSIKKMIRFIMLSNTYQESSDDVPANRKVDPENRLLWRMDRQRLDFEAMRDSVLAASNTIDLHIGGPSVDV